MFDNSFTTISVSYRKATYHLEKPRFGAIGVLAAVVSELCKKRMPPSRVWMLLHAGAKCSKITAGVKTRPEDSLRPFVDNIVTRIVFEPNATVSPYDAGEEMANAMDMLGNAGVGGAPADLFLLRKGKEYPLPSIPNASSKVLEDIYAKG